jgi:hypothetical protein
MTRQSFKIDSKRYFKEIKSLFPVYGKEEKLFLANLMSDAEEYIASNSECDYAQFILEFGEPKTIVSQYIADADSAHLSKQIRTARIVKICAAIVAAAVICTALINVVIAYVSFIEARDSYIAREVIVINEESKKEQKK